MGYLHSKIGVRGRLLAPGRAPGGPGLLMYGSLNGESRLYLCGREIRRQTYADVMSQNFPDRTDEEWILLTLVVETVVRSVRYRLQLYCYRTVGVAVPDYRVPLRNAALRVGT